MATVVEPETAAPEPDSRIFIPGVDWETYEATLALWGDRPFLRFTYDRGSLEIMSPSPERDEWARAFDFFVVHAAAGLGLPCRPLGTATWRKKAAKRGLEADACFYLASCPRVRGKKKFDLSVDPPPDLAIEVELSRSDVDRMEVYASLGVPEVWRFDGEDLQVWQPQPDGSYAESPNSLSFPHIGLDEVVHWLELAATTEDLADWLGPLQAWVRDDVLPRVQRR